MIAPRGPFTAALPIASGSGSASGSRDFIRSSSSLGGAGSPEPGPSTAPPRRSAAPSSSTIDLTGPSPPIGSSRQLAGPGRRTHSEMEVDGGAQATTSGRIERSQRRRTDAGAVASASSSRAPPPRRTNPARTTRNSSPSLVFGDSSSDDDDLIVVSGGAGPSNPRPQAAAARGRRVAPSTSSEDLIITGGSAAAGSSRARSTASAARAAPNRSAFRIHSPQPHIMPPPRRMPPPPPRIPPPPAPRETSGLAHLRALMGLGAGGGFNFGLQHIARGGLFHGFEDDFEDQYDFELYDRMDRIPSGLQGLFPPGGSGWSGAKPKAAKKYTIKSSHPRKIEEGFSRAIIHPADMDDSTPPPVVVPKKKGKGKAKAKEVVHEDLVIVCASCLETLRLAQSGLGRPWILRCGHTVCGKCVAEAKKRCQEIKDNERKARWQYDITNTGKANRVGANGRGKGKAAEVLNIDDSDEDLEYLDTVQAPQTKGKAAGKGKGKSKAIETGVEDGWTTCPVVSCDGSGTDMLAPEGDFSGPFEAFV